MPFASSAARHSAQLFALRRENEFSLSNFQLINAESLRSSAAVGTRGEEAINNNKLPTNNGHQHFFLSLRVLPLARVCAIFYEPLQSFIRRLVRFNRVSSRYQPTNRPVFIRPDTWTACAAGNSSSKTKQSAQMCASGRPSAKCARDANASSV